MNENDKFYILKRTKYILESGTHCNLKNQMKNK